MVPRAAVLEAVADAVLATPVPGARRVGVDGVDGAGKTFFADELGAVLEARGMPVIRASVDGFHHPAAVRYRRGRSSPEGFYQDSYDYERLTILLLRPLSPGGSGRFVPSVYDVRREQPVDAEVELAQPGSVLVLDGIFLHRPELAGFWDYSVFLDVPFEVSIPRGARRGHGDPNPAAAANHRYVAGQLLYLRECQPRARALIVIDNTDLAHPRVIG